ncbi:flippase [Acinetobacter sp. KAM398]|uniref:polysaccharide biosynthesis protein n=1 Tax=unclassified Acinetobacter TaxID=196816 RepID=UPI001F179AEA|nr:MULTISPECIES: polysaccharide biosynthesis protein [unclassified Acinetobacter]GJC31960.1 flippase [Acinetobacter sp. KAM392]GJC34745.1 flippase [Acinetobacter sp. KAM393]GJC37576.1 flippase [Acinetobacter sp. KAM394]GJC40393.1 flippase [Acinetobacter sp. KAM395]GJC43279.1 flippase [Acinetobacter sp. KAM396]
MYKLIVRSAKDPRIKNSIWMMSEKLIAIFGLIFVTSFVAKYIGPENFGKLTFVGSIFAILQTLSLMGTENIIFQKTAKNRKIGENIIYASKRLRDYIYGSLSIITLGGLYFYTDRLTYIFGISTCIAIYFAVHDVYSIYFNAILESKINAYCNITALIISLSVRYLIVLFQLPIETLGIPIILLTLIPFLLRKYLYAKKKLSVGIMLPYAIKRYRQYTFAVGQKLLLYSLSVAIFTKTAQLFLGLESQFDLGIYTVAMTLGNSFYFVLLAIISSYFTGIYQEESLEKSQNNVAQLYMVVVVISLFVTLGLYLFGPWVVSVLYGVEFIRVTEILWLAGLVTLFSGLSTIAEKYLIKFNAYEYLKRKTFILVFFNVILTFLMVKLYGLYGGIYAILTTEILSVTLFNYFFRNGLIWNTQKRMFLISTYLKR